MTTINVGTADPPSFAPMNYSPQVQVPLMGDKPGFGGFSPFSQSPMTTICLFTIIFSFGFFFGGSLGGLPFGPEKLVVESRGRSLFEAPTLPQDGLASSPGVDDALGASGPPLQIEGGGTEDCTNSTGPCEGDQGKPEETIKEL
jgi:hypothetical protein